MMPSGHKAFLVSNVKDVELLLMHNKVFAAEYVSFPPPHTPRYEQNYGWGSKAWDVTVWQWGISILTKVCS